MTYQITLYILAGALLQMLLIARPYLHLTHKLKRKDIRNFVAGTFIFSIISSILYIIDRGYIDYANLGLQFLTTFLAFYIIFSAGFLYLIYKDTLHIQINEFKLYYISFLITYLLLYAKANSIFIMIGIVGTLFFALLNIIKVHVTQIFRVLFYLWFLICNLILINIQSGKQIGLFLDGGILVGFSFLDYFFTGMILVYFALNILSLSEFSPLPGKRQSWNVRKQQLKEHFYLLFKRYGERETSIIFTILFTVASLVFFSITPQLVNNPTIIVILFFIVCYFIDYKNIPSAKFINRRIVIAKSKEDSESDFKDITY